MGVFDWEMLQEVNLVSTIVRLGLALILGGMLGMERGRKRRPAGLRTYMIVCIGSALVMVTSQYMMAEFGTGDPARMGAQVISGIGFLGVGTIMITSRQVKGLTTAAGLWSSAAVGLALGVGFYEAAVIAGVTIYFVMNVLQHWDVHVHRKAKYMDIYLEYSK